MKSVKMQKVQSLFGAAHTVVRQSQSRISVGDFETISILGRMCGTNSHGVETAVPFPPRAVDRDCSAAIIQGTHWNECL